MRLLVSSICSIPGHAAMKVVCTLVAVRVTVDVSEAFKIFPNPARVDTANFDPGIENWLRPFVNCGWSNYFGNPG